MLVQHRREHHEAQRQADRARPVAAPREAEVLLWVAQGKSSPDIAGILGMSDATAKKHVCNILAKLGVESRQAAMFSALEVLCQPRR